MAKTHARSMVPFNTSAVAGIAREDADIVRIENGGDILEQVDSVLEEALRYLNEDEREVVLHKLGFVKGPPKSDSQIAALMDIGRSEVTTIKARAFEKLRSTPVAEALRALHQSIHEARARLS